MKNNLSLLWQERDNIKIKQKGLSSIASFAISNNTKIQGKNNKFVWPSPMNANNLENFSQKKTWRI